MTDERVEEIRTRRAAIDRSYSYKSDEVERLKNEMDALNEEDRKLWEELQAALKHEGEVKP